jgi:hypothetical protein
MIDIASPRPREKETSSRMGRVPPGVGYSFLRFWTFSRTGLCPDLSALIQRKH